MPWLVTQKTMDAALESQTQAYEKKLGEMERRIRRDMAPPQNVQLQLSSNEQMTADQLITRLLQIIRPEMYSLNHATEESDLADRIYAGVDVDVIQDRLVEQIKDRVRQDLSMPELLRLLSDQLYDDIDSDDVVDGIVEDLGERLQITLSPIQE